MIIVVTGLPGTGKTTLAMALANALKVAHLNTDKLRIEMNCTGKYDEETKQLVYDALLFQAEERIKSGATIIIDGTFSKMYRRALLEALAAYYKVPIQWISIEAEEACVKKRLMKKRLYSEADYAAYQKVKQGYDPLKGEFLELHSDYLSLEEMVDLALQYVTINA